MNLATIYRGPNSVDPPRMVLLTGPGVEPLTLAEAKAWIRVTNNAEDALITDLITAARMHFESVTGISCITQQWQLQYSSIPVRYGEYGLEYGLAPSMTRFVGAPNGREFILPRAPFISLDEFKYKDGSGVQQTFDITPGVNLTLGSVGSRNSFGRIWLNDGVDWPEIGNFPDAIQIKFTAGLGSDPSVATYPRDLKMAIRWLVAHYYENRGAAGQGDTLQELPFSLRSVIENYRVAFVAG